MSILPGHRPLLHIVSELCALESGGCNICISDYHNRAYLLCQLQVFSPSQDFRTTSRSSNMSLSEKTLEPKSFKSEYV